MTTILKITKSERHNRGIFTTELNRSIFIFPDGTAASTADILPVPAFAEKETISERIKECFEMCVALHPSTDPRFSHCFIECSNSGEKPMEMVNAQATGSNGGAFVKMK